MASKILSFICHVPGVIPGAYPAAPTTDAGVVARSSAPDTKRSGSSNGASSGHFTAIYENEKFVRFKYISNG